MRNEGILRSPIVSTSPPSSWSLHTNITESDLDPAFRRSAHASPTIRRRRDQARRELLSLAIFVALAGALLTYLWPSLSFALRTPISIHNPSTRIDLEPPRPYIHTLPRTSKMAPFWRHFREILTSGDEYEAWFDDANESQHVIETMFATIPSPSEVASYTQPHDEVAYNRTRDAIKSRAEHLKLARGEWSKFLMRRARVLGRVVSEEANLHVYVDGKPVKGSGGNELSQALTSITEILEKSPSTLLTPAAVVAPPKPKSKPTSEITKVVEVVVVEVNKESSPSVLTLSVRRINDELVRAHRELFSHGESDDIHRHMDAAQAAERIFIGRLRSTSSKGRLWTAHLAKALPRLAKRLVGLEKQRKEMQTSLDWLQRNILDVDFSDADTHTQTKGKAWYEKQKEQEEKKKKKTWVKNAQELWLTWNSVQTDAQEGVLFWLRRQDLKIVEVTTGKMDLEASWEEWKSRNCGDTSCYDATPPPSVLENVKKLFEKKNKRPTAGVAEDEKAWSLGDDGAPKVWRGVYEKACCENGKLAQLLKLGADQPAAIYFAR